MGGCQNYGPFLGTLNIRCRIRIGTQKGTIIFDNHPYGGLRPKYENRNGIWDLKRSYELESKLLKGGYIGDYIGDYYRGY